MCFGFKSLFDPTQAFSRPFTFAPKPLKTALSSTTKTSKFGAKPKFDMASDPRYANICFAADGSIVNLNNLENPSEPKVTYGKPIPQFERSTVWKYVKPPKEYDHLVTSEL